MQLSRNACKPDRGIETVLLPQWAESLEVGTLVSPIEGLKRYVIDWLIKPHRDVGTLVSPIEGLKLKPSMSTRAERECRNACKPDRGIETARLAASDPGH